MMESTTSWEHPEWYACASAWIEEQLANVSRDVLAPLEQVRWWGLSRVLRVRTSGGSVYFKASARQPLFANEGILLKYLTNVCPDQVPKIIATEPAFRWMLLEDAGPVVSGTASPETRTVILKTFAELQYASVEHVDQLLATCCVDRRVQTLIPEIEPLMNDELVTSKLMASEIGELQRKVPDFIEMCSHVSEHAVLPTLIHGDLHSENVIINDGKLVFIDWAEACIAHPFMDAFMIYNEDDDAVRNRMRDVYLQVWTDFESMEQLRELWSLCSVVHSIHHAVSYLTILRNTEARWQGELEGTLPFLLRKSLRYLHEPA